MAPIHFFSGGLLGLPLLLITLAIFVFWIWMLVDCLQNPRLKGVDKLVWVLVVLFLHILGAIIYFLVGRNRA